MSILADRIADVDILAVVTRYTQVKRKAGTNGGEYAGPCPLCGGTDRFLVWPQHPSGRGRFWCRNESCPAHRGGDVVDLVRLVESLDFPDALRFLGIPPPGDASPPRGPSRQRTLSHMMPPPPPPPRGEKGAAARPRPVDLTAVAQQAQHHLWRREGAAAMAWLRGRGLTEDTIWQWGLGYNPASRRVNATWLPQGIFIPYREGEEVVAIKVRRLPHPEGRPKYLWVKGSRVGFFGLSRLEARRVLVVVESELDAILVWQEAGDLVDAVATGSAAYRPTAEELTLLARSPHWLLIRDHDAAGQGQAAWWSSFSGRVEAFPPPRGKDPTEYVQQGGDLRAWLIEEGVKRGWFRVVRRVMYPITIIWPPGTHPAVVAGRWRRRANGDIVATYRTRAELAAALGCMTSSSR